MLHTVKLVGPGLIAFVAVGVLIWVASAYVALDAVRRLKTDYAGVIEGRWFYAIPQGAFFVAFLAWQIPWVETNLPWVGWMVVAVPFALAQQMAYLLRVVFPTAKRLEKRLEAERAAGIVRVAKPVTGRRAARAEERRQGGERRDDATEYFDDIDDGSTPDA